MPAYQGEPGLCNSSSPLERPSLDGKERSNVNGLQEKGCHNRCLQLRLGALCKGKPTFGHWSLPDLKGHHVLIHSDSMSVVFSTWCLDRCENPSTSDLSVTLSFLQEKQANRWAGTLWLSASWGVPRGWIRLGPSESLHETCSRSPAHLRLAHSLWPATVHYPSVIIAKDCSALSTRAGQASKRPAGTLH